MAAATEQLKQQEFLPPEKIIPLKLVVKFEPPVIGLLYKRNENDKKKHIYNILLNGLINNPNTEQITQQIFDEHNVFLNKKIVTFEQIQGLVLRIQEYFVNLANLDEEEIQALQQGGIQGQYMGEDGQIYYDQQEEMQQRMMQQEMQGGSGQKFNKKNSF